MDVAFRGIADPGRSRSADIPSGLFWSVRSSFVDYVQALPDGRITTSGNVDVDPISGFRFPYAGFRRHGPSWKLSFEGAVSFSGHFGTMLVSIQNPEIHSSTAGVSLIAQTSQGRTEIAMLPRTGPVRIEQHLVWPAMRPVLTESGAALFDWAYAAGTEMDDIRVAIGAGEAGREAATVVDESVFR